MSQFGFNQKSVLRKVIGQTGGKNFKDALALIIKKLLWNLKILWFCGGGRGVGVACVKAYAFLGTVALALCYQ